MRDRAAMSGRALEVAVDAQSAQIGKTDRMIGQDEYREGAQGEAPSLAGRVFPQRHCPLYQRAWYRLEAHRPARFRCAAQHGFVGRRHPPILTTDLFHPLPEGVDGRLR